MRVHEADPLSISIREHPGLVGVKVADYATDGRLFRSVKDRFGSVRIFEGQSEWWGLGRVWRAGPEQLALKVPGMLHRELRRDGPARFQVLSYDGTLVAETRLLLGLPFAPPASLSIETRSPHGLALARMHDAVALGAPRLALQSALVSAVTAMVELTSRRSPSAALLPVRPVRRALELLHERLDGDVTLDELAAHAGQDKFHLVRAFTQVVGLSPYAWLTHRRIGRAQTLLAQGSRPSEVAARVGLYDQSQLNRHFKRIVGITPGAYALARA